MPAGLDSIKEADNEATVQNVEDLETVREHVDETVKS